MPKLKLISAKKLIRFLENEGFEETRQSGSHVILVKKGFSPLSIPFHAGKDLGRGLIGSILESAGISKEKYQKEA